MGWPVLVMLVGLLIYFQMSISDPTVRKRVQFKTFIGMIAAAMLFIAIANYKLNFTIDLGDGSPQAGNSRLLPVSLTIITVLSFLMGIYFANIAALFKIGG